jgi:hypothetical protein
MRPISQFFSQSNDTERHERKKISLSGMINSFSRLSIIQMKRNLVTFDDILNCLNSSYGGNISSEDVKKDVSQSNLRIYAGMIYETAFETVLTENGPVLCLKSEMIGNEVVFLKGLVSVMTKHAAQGSGGSQYLIDMFMNDATMFLKKNTFDTEMTSSPRDAHSHENNINVSGGDQSGLNVLLLNAGHASHLDQSVFLPTSSVNVDYSKGAGNLVVDTKSSSSSSSSFSVARIHDGKDHQSNTFRDKTLSSFEGKSNYDLFISTIPCSVSSQSLTSSCSSSTPSRTPQSVYSIATLGQFPTGSPIFAMRKVTTHEHAHYPVGSQEFFTTKSNYNNNAPDPSPPGFPLPLNLEKNDHMMKFLSSIRKSGMDILFPQIIHDKVSIFFVIYLSVISCHVFFMSFFCSLDVNDHLCCNEDINNSYTS